MGCQESQTISISQARQIAAKAITNSSAELVVYTAVIGDYDDPPEIKSPQSSDVEFICVSDRQIEISEPWQLVLVDKEDLSSLVQAKIYKLFPHVLFPKSKRSVWIDGTINIIGDISRLINSALNKNIMATFAHPSRKCAYMESKACKRLGKEKKDIIDMQVKKYKAAGFRKNMGLLHGAVLFRQHNDEKVIKAMEEWWGELIEHSMRDQLSFNYIAWKNKLPVETLDTKFSDNEYLVWSSHKNPIGPLKYNRSYKFWLMYYRLDKYIKKVLNL